VRDPQLLDDSCAQDERVQVALAQAAVHGVEGVEQRQPFVEDRLEGVGTGSGLRNGRYRSDRPRYPDAKGVGRLKGVADVEIVGVRRAQSSEGWVVAYPLTWASSQVAVGPCR
jgi:hypothetical protein